MTGAHGNPLLGEQVGQVGIVHALDDKAGQCQLGVPESRMPLRARRPSTDAM